MTPEKYRKNEGVDWDHVHFVDAADGTGTHIFAFLSGGISGAVMVAIVYGVVKWLA